MKGHLGNEAATAATFDPDGWLKTDMGYFDEDGFHLVDRMKELIKHNGYQSGAKCRWLGRNWKLFFWVIPSVEDEEAGQIPMAYVVRTPGSELTEEQVIQFVANQVAPYKKVRREGFISAIPKSACWQNLEEGARFPQPTSYLEMENGYCGLNLPRFEVLYVESLTPSTCREKSCSITRNCLPPERETGKTLVSEMNHKNRFPSRELYDIVLHKINKYIK
ncbi:LONG-CHAIN-FATTY-ACID--COA LIGASE [Salix purpurea]|uniref:LONG-CHAIN-FATTY-ACID--COA LIGASE n=1 Tax=Salix purpurea TaxID=77065 RepID=A0A9Q0TTI6_SALPP|nr:LONG-CHAIN-FATTY-ACID--COA LIGASE [Salix purpurea]